MKYLYLIITFYFLVSGISKLLSLISGTTFSSIFIPSDAGISFQVVYFGAHLICVIFFGRLSWRGFIKKDNK